MMEYNKVTHEFEPVYNADSRILILGSFPSVKSRENSFYYGHPKNRFWRMLSAVFGQREPETVDGKKAFLLANGLAVWDVIDTCEIAGSSDSSIRNVKVNDMERILKEAGIEKILLNGAKAYELFVRYCRAEHMPPIKKLPSTSPANAAWSLERLTEVWGSELRERESEIW